MENFIRWKLEKNDMSIDDIVMEWISLSMDEKIRIKRLLQDDIKPSCKICIKSFNKTFSRLLNDLVKNSYISSLVFSNNFSHIFKSQQYKILSNLERLFKSEEINDIISDFIYLKRDFVNRYLNFNMYN